MSLFRKNALDALNSPEKLDQPLNLLRQSYWSILISLGGFSLSLILWSVFGRLPVRISGKGVLINKESLQLIQSEIQGRVKELMVDIGECVEEGEAMVHIHSIKNKLEQKKAQDRLENLLTTDKTLDLIALQRKNDLKEILNKWRNAWEQGAISEIKWLEKKQSLGQLIYEQTQRDNDRQQQIINLRTEINALNQERISSSIVKAPYSGCITDRYIQIGELMQPGKSLFELNREVLNGTNKLQSLAYFKAKDGKRLSIGQAVRILPTNTKPNRHGGIEGEIIAINTLPISKDAVVNRLGKKESLFKAISTNGEDPLIEVSTSLKENKDTPSGYDWGGNKGPNIKLTAGTTTLVRVLVEQRRPISYVIPLLRDLTGIY